MSAPRLFLNLLPHTLHIANSDVCDLTREVVAHVTTVSWSVSDGKVENTLELTGQFIGGFGLAPNWLSVFVPVIGPLNKRHQFK